MIHLEKLIKAVISEPSVNNRSPRRYTGCFTMRCNNSGAMIMRIAITTPHELMKSSLEDNNKPLRN